MLWFYLFIYLFVSTDGLSFDGVPNEITVTVLVGVCALFVILSAAGIVLALVAMLMHFLLRQKV